jgi:prepilin-type N-terminal cleavage/methylation domain-containing protein
MKSWRCEPARGFTLVEVVAGLTLAAGLLVGSLLAFSAHRKQRRTADAKLAAVAIAEELLTAWSSSSTGIPNFGGGEISGRPDWLWRTRLVDTTTLIQVPLHVIRLEVIEVSGEGSLRPLATVDVVEPIQQ